MGSESGETMSDSGPTLTVYYDGGCRVCSAEIDYYQRRDSGGRLRCLDITAPDFVPAAHGCSLAEFMARLHVRDARGNFTTGIAAFVAIWQVLPQQRYRWLSRFFSLPVVRPVAESGYTIFARNRKYLPRRRAECDSERCSHRHP
jgi:predicted DCC family thiol-disulfide oxidoreductase YuxK